MEKKLSFIFLIIGFIVFSYSIAFADNNNSKLPDKKNINGLIYAADVISVQGKDFKIKRISSPHWMRGRVNMPNYVKDILETDKNTVACIEFSNGSQLGINKGTLVEIISSTEAKDITQRGVVQKVILKTGTLWAKIRGRDSKGFKVQTSKGTLGVRGTEFVVENDPEDNTEKVTVLEGEVEYSSEDKPLETITPGEEVTFEVDKPIERKRRNVQKLRDALSLRFPGLNPTEQAIISAVVYGAIGRIPNAGRALGIAHQTIDLIDNPERFVANYAASQLNRVSPIGVPVGMFGGGSRRTQKKDPNRYTANNLSPTDGSIVETYYPEFNWDKVDKAASYRVIITKKPLIKGEQDPEYVAFTQTKENKMKYSPVARMLKPGETYYWTVISLNDKDKPIAKPHQPIKIQMADYQTMGIRGLYPVGDIEPIEVENEMVFDWTPVQGVSKYEFKLMKIDGTPITIMESDTNSIILKDAKTLLLKDNIYCWKVTPKEKEEDIPEIKSIMNSFKVVERKDAEK